MSAEEVLISKVNGALSRHDYATATWLCERLCATIHIDDTIGQTKAQHLLATCHYHNGKPNRVYFLLKGVTHTESRYLFALSCYELLKFHEGEMALLGATSAISEGSVELVPGAEGFHLLGLICQRLSRREQAIAYFKQSLALDSFSWASFQALCELGADVDSETMFRVYPPTLPPAAESPTLVVASPPRHDLEDFITPLQPRPRRSGRLNGPAVSDANKKRSKRLSGEFLSSTPAYSIRGRHLAVPNSAVTATPAEPTTPEFKANKAHGPPPQKLRSKITKTPESHIQQLGDTTYLSPERPIVAKPRTARARGSRQPRFNLLESVEGPRSPDTSPPPTIKQPERRRGSVGSVAAAMNANNAAFLDLRRLATAFALQSDYKCKDAVEIYQTVSQQHLGSAWVLAQLGRCYFDMVDYHKSIAMFQRAIRLEPFRMAGLEFYSTALWHLKKEVELSFLAQQAIEHDKLAAEAWIVVSFSTLSLFISQKICMLSVCCVCVWCVVCVLCVCVGMGDILFLGWELFFVTKRP